MNWDLHTASGREKMLIRDRKLSALYAMMPDIMPDRPYSSFKYLADDCVLTSETLDRPLQGIAAVKDFLIREKQSYDGLTPIPICEAAETEDGDVLLRIRPWKAEVGELVRLELNGEGKVCRIDRFSEKRIPYRVAGPSVTLTPATRTENGIKNIEEEAAYIPDLYESELKLLFYLQGDVFTDMEDRYMDTDEWITLSDNWKRINAVEDPDALRASIMRSEEKFTRENPRYARELEELIDDTLENRDPYGRRMQAMLEDWLNGFKGRYELIRKC